MSEKPGAEWIGTPLDTVDPRGIVEFDEGEEVLTPKIKERFGSYDLSFGVLGEDYPNVDFDLVRLVLVNADDGGR